ncbi:hypothetical protein BTR22_05240 [Alkalihalophilus pseudofirmus]|uniref:hypothetical protein n=1 Tax=Alkalihalophilus pseudofirmus TaxID=79885 RepID=UPI00095126BE|nr:hypothetical protein BTR22_05240 [Alkalihalophilus pseudofirmus]
MILTGDTIRLRVHFKSYKGHPVDAEDVILTIYNKSLEVIETFKDTNKESNGVYFYDYKLPDEEQEFIFEFRGVYDEKPIISRGTFSSKFY